MTHITRIDHQVRKALLLSILEYCVADLIHTSKEAITREEITLRLDSRLEHVDRSIARLVDLQLAKIGARSRKLTVTSAWKQAVKPPKKERKGDPLNHELRKEVERRIPDYYWNDVIDYQHADKILANLRFKFQTHKGREGTDEEILASLTLVLDNLPEFWQDKWDVKKVENNLNSIVTQIRAKVSKPNAQGKLVEAMQSVDAAAEALKAEFEERNK